MRKTKQMCQSAREELLLSLSITYIEEKNDVGLLYLSTRFHYWRLFLSLDVFGHRRAEEIESSKTVFQKSLHKTVGFTSY